MVCSRFKEFLDDIDPALWPQFVDYVTGRYNVQRQRDPKSMSKVQPPQSDLVVRLVRGLPCARGAIKLGEPGIDWWFHVAATSTRIRPPESECDDPATAAFNRSYCFGESDFMLVVVDSAVPWLAEKLSADQMEALTQLCVAIGFAVIDGAQIILSPF